MKRPINSQTFADAATADLGYPETDAFFAKCEQHFSWLMLRDQGLVLHEGTLVDAMIIETPKGWVKNMGYHFVRYWGLACNGFDFALMAGAYNFKRSFSLVKPTT